MSTAGRLGRTTVSLALWGLVVLLIGAIVGVGATSGQEPNHASLVVVYPDGRVETMCVEFDEETISGAELLRRSGLSVVFSGAGGFGEGVCRIDDTGCSDPGNCFCQCSGGDCAYWSYFALNDDREWQFQQIGASQRTLRDGDVDAWIWGSGRAPPAGAELAGQCADEEQEIVKEEPEPAPATISPQPNARAEQAPAQVDDSEPVADESVIVEAPAPTLAGAPTVAEPLVEADVDADDTEPPLEPEAIDVPDDSSGPPMGLIAFGAVALALAGLIGALALRRRLSG
ncbi:MAG: hypothetical protein IH865_00465 [Chloroflexi bacterium]|nr:hypothetical protein [Chloroflexota bacterium]